MPQTYTKSLHTHSPITRHSIHLHTHISHTHTVTHWHTHTHTHTHTILCYLCHIHFVWRFRVCFYENNYSSENQRRHNCKCFFVPLLYSLFLFVNVSQEPNQSSQWNRSVTVTTLHTFIKVDFPLLKVRFWKEQKSRKAQQLRDRKTLVCTFCDYCMYAEIVWCLLQANLRQQILDELDEVMNGDDGEEEAYHLLGAGGWVGGWVDERMGWWVRGREGASAWMMLSLSFRRQCSRWWQSSWWGPPALRGNIWWFQSASTGYTRHFTWYRSHG